MDIDSIALQLYALADLKGWHEVPVKDPHVLTSRIALIMGECSEAIECVRDRQRETFLGEDGKPEGLPIELADVLIRTLDLMVELGIQPSKVIRTKFDYNKTRAHRHGGRAL